MKVIDLKKLLDIIYGLLSTFAEFQTQKELQTEKFDR